LSAAKACSPSASPEPVVADVSGQHDLLLAGLTGDRAGAGVVLAGFGVGVAVLVVTELSKHGSVKITV
jgi:NaMN:DMB phosphoribosyltransferase